MEAKHLAKYAKTLPCFLPLSSHKYYISLFPSLKSNSKLIEKIWKGNTQGKITITSDPSGLLESSMASGLSNVSFLPWFACLWELVFRYLCLVCKPSER